MDAGSRVAGPADRDREPGRAGPGSARIGERGATARRLPAAGLLLALAAALGACGRSSPVDPRRAALEAERATVETYLRADPAEPLVPTADVLVVVRSELVDRLLDAALPLEAVVADRYRLRLDSATVELVPGMARVRLAARASLADAPGVFADVGLVGSFEIEPFPEEGQDLSARVRIFGLETRDLAVGGLAPPAERLVDRLARLRAREYRDVLDRVQIPVRLIEVLQIPAVEEKQVTIPAAELPVRFELAAVRVLEDGIFIALRVQRGWTDVARWSAGGLDVEEGGMP